MADQSIPLKISIAPFPEGFQGDMDETFQQGVQLMGATVEGSFLTGLVLAPGSTLPTVDVGPVAMGGQWYFWNPNISSYQPQSSVTKPLKNYAKNGSYQVQQTGSTPTLTAGVNKIYDMARCWMTPTAGVLTIAADIGPTAGADYDTCPAAIRYTVGTTASSLGSTDLYAHEHLVEGADLAAIQGEPLSLSFLCWVNQPGVYSAYLCSGARDVSYCTTFTMPTANTWTRIKISGIPAMPSLGTPTGTWTFGEGQTGLYIGIVMACGAQWKTANTGQWNAGLFLAGTTQSNMVSVTTNQMKITAVRLEASAQCGYAVINSFDDDFWDCIRYYFSTFNYSTSSPFAAGFAVQSVCYAAAATLMSFAFPRRMAKIPSVVPYGWVSHTAGNVTNISSSNTDIANATLTATQKGLVATPTVTAATTGQSIACLIVADARLT
jgi:hypothetical protein